MSATATVWLQDFAGTRKVIAPWSAHCCWGSLMTPALCSMSAFARVSALRSGRNWRNFSARIVPMRSPLTRGKHWAEACNRPPMKASSACRVAKAAGAKARTCRGNHCVPNWWWRSLTTTCKEAASVIRRSSADGEPTKSPATAPTPSSKWFRRRNWKRFFPHGR